MHVPCECNFSRAAAVHRKAFKVGSYWEVSTACGCLPKLKFVIITGFTSEAGYAHWWRIQYMQVACRCHFSRAAVVHRTGFIKVSLYWKVDTASGGSPEFKLVVTTSFRSEAEHPHGCRIRALQVLCKCRLSRAAAVHRKAFKVSLYWAVDTASGGSPKFKHVVTTRFSSEAEHPYGCRIRAMHVRATVDCLVLLRYASVYAGKRPALKLGAAPKADAGLGSKTRHPSSFHFKTPGKGSF